MDTKRAGNISDEQKSLMTEFMTIHPELRKGKFTKEFTFKDAQKLWEDLTQQLNQLNGSSKDWKAWRKTWHDLSSRAKVKKQTILKYQTRTGGGQQCPDKLTDLEETITNLLGEVLIDGHPATQESLVINFLNDESNLLLGNELNPSSSSETIFPESQPQSNRETIFPESQPQSNLNKGRGHKHLINSINEDGEQNMCPKNQKGSVLHRKVLSRRMQQQNK